MLGKYSVENFKSFKIKTTVDMERTNYKVLDGTNVEGNVLKGVLFVGANASGKSNIVLVVKLLLDLLFGKTDINFELYPCLFSDNNIMKLEYDFFINNSKIKYYFDYQRKDKLIIEKLIIDEKEVMNRLGGVAQTIIAEKLSYDDIASNTTMLKKIRLDPNFAENIILQKWFDFLANSAYFDFSSQKVSVYEEGGFSIQRHLFEINNFLKVYKFEYTIECSENENFDDDIVFIKRNGMDMKIPLSMETLGIRILIDMLACIFFVLNNGGILILDKFNGLHDNLQKIIIKYFMNHAKNAQLIIVSHSTNLLTTSLYRPDQIYAVNFDTDGSNVVRFSDEQPRVGQNLEKMYLGGIFSGLPCFEENNLM